MKEKFELEFLFKTSPRVLENMISTPGGLAEWFADDVNHEGDLYSFEWDGNIEQANLLFNKNNSKVRFKWVNDDGDFETYFEISSTVDPMTASVSLQIIDFAYTEDKESAILLWNQQVGDLKRILGA
jgi:hypothetical protein